MWHEYSCIELGIFNILHPFQNFSPPPTSSLWVNHLQIPQFGCRKCQKEWNRWFKRQLAKRTAADLLNSVVTWSKDDHQLILPNYSDMPLGCRRQHVQSRFCCCTHFWTRATGGAHIQQRGVSDKSPCRSEGQKAEGSWGWKEGRGSSLAFIPFPFPEALCRALALQQCWSHLWVLSAEAT